MKRVTDVDQDAWKYFRKTRADASVKTPKKVVTRVQMRATAEACPDPFSLEGVKTPLFKPCSDLVWTLC
jgi:hypothetical protein